MLSLHNNKHVFYHWSGDRHFWDAWSHRSDLDFLWLTLVILFGWLASACRSLLHISKTLAKCFSQFLSLCIQLALVCLEMSYFLLRNKVFFFSRRTGCLSMKTNHVGIKIIFKQKRKFFIIICQISLGGGGGSAVNRTLAWAFKKKPSESFQEKLMRMTLDPILIKLKRAIKKDHAQP